MRRARPPRLFNAEQRRILYLPGLVLIPVLACFLLKDAETLRQSGLNVLPQRVRARGYGPLGEMNTTLAAYIRAQRLACVLEFIPLVGPLLLAVVAGAFLAIPAVAALSVAWRHGLEWLDEPPEPTRV